MTHAHARRVRDRRCHIVPDYVLVNIATNAIAAAAAPSGEGGERPRGRRSTRAAGLPVAAGRAAVSTLALNATLRARRGAGLEARRAWFQLGRELRPRVGRLGLGAALPPVKQRTVFDAGHTQQLPGSEVRGEGDPPSADVGVNEAFDYAGATLDFYYQALGRDSIDGLGMPVDSTVHFDQDYDNAFWNGSQMVYGDGDGQIFNRFTIDIDVVGHELTHGVTEREAGLIYAYQPGALNESVSDVFGSLVKQFAAGQSADQADWLIGEHLFTGAVNGTALRSMKAPGTAYNDPALGKDPQPANMANFVRTSSDNGGVHINSGIPNHAFYLAATAIGGPAWERAGLVWYTALRSPYLRPATRFRGFALLTSGAAQRLFGAQSKEADAVRGAWNAVGVLQ